MAVRLKDIAQDLGLSVVTVSKVLREHPDIGAGPLAEKPGGSTMDSA